MDYFEVVLKILGFLVLSGAVAFGLIKLYLQTWVPELVKAEVHRQYSLSEESTGDRLSACKTLITVLDKAKDNFDSTVLAAMLLLVLTPDEDDTLADLRDGLIKKAK